jgi:hypothetical protein
MRLYRLSLILFLLFPFVVLAQTATITGRVAHGESKSPLANASVFLNNATYGTSTAEDGTFTLSGVNPASTILLLLL